MAAVQQYGYALQNASDELKGNKEIVLTAVQENGMSLQFASHELKAVEDILAAVQEIDQAFQFPVINPIGRH